jgi:hypothetical protein
MYVALLEIKPNQRFAMTQIVEESADEGHEPDPAYADECRLLARIERITDDKDLVPYRKTLQRWVRRAAIDPTFADKLGTTRDYLGHLFRASSRETAVALFRRLNAFGGTQSWESDLVLLRQVVADAAPRLSFKEALHFLLGISKSDLVMLELYYAYKQFLIMINPLREEFEGERELISTHARSLSQYWFLERYMDRAFSYGRVIETVEQGSALLLRFGRSVQHRTLMHCRRLLGLAQKLPYGATFYVRELQAARQCLPLKSLLGDHEITLERIGTTEEELAELARSGCVRDAA